MCEKKQFVSFECLRTFYFQFLAAVNTAAVNILVQIFLHTHACISLRYASRNEIAGSLDGVCLVSVDTDSFPKCFILLTPSSKFQLTTSLP